MLFNEHYVILIYAMKLWLIYAMKLLFKYAMKLLMCDKGAFNIGYWSRRRPSRQTSFLLN